MDSTHTDLFFRTEADLALGDARREKALRTKDQGSPIQLPGKPLAMTLSGDDLWIAESGGVARKISLESDKTLQVLRGHNGPVTCIALLPSTSYIFTGSWDKSIKVWNAKDSSLVCSVEAHSDFIKCLLVIPSISVLASGGSDKTIRFWDLSNLSNGSLMQIGSRTEHRRPVECLTYDPGNTTSETATMFSADSMGVIYVWGICRETEPFVQCRATIKAELGGHRTGINDMWFGLGQLWTGSTDCTVVMQAYPPTPSHPKPSIHISMRHPVKALLPLLLTPVNEDILIAGSGDILTSYDVASPTEPEVLGGVNGHWHDITVIRLWVKKLKDPSGALSFTPIVVSASLDGTVRRWPLNEIISPMPPMPIGHVDHSRVKKNAQASITDKELDELLNSDEE